MALFVISWRDRPGGLPLRMATREAHLAYVGGFSGQVKLGGPYLDEAGNMAGSLIIIDLPDLAAAQAFHDADPYRLAGLMETSTVTPWRATVGPFA